MELCLKIKKVFEIVVSQMHLEEEKKKNNLEINSSHIVCVSLDLVRLG